MNMFSDLGLFLLSVGGISLSGVALPGPLTAATIAKGFNNKNAGIMIGVGHGLVELPIILLIYFGFSPFITYPPLTKIIGVLGGIMLVFMGYMILRSLGKKLGQAADLPANSFVTGVIMTGTNPYFYLWWATIGAALILGSIRFGILGLIAFLLIHWLCDIGWEQLVSLSVFKTRHLWTTNVRQLVFVVCAIFLMGFGVWFGVSVFIS
jgi:threonine/homoserine/homoserine lactone efflux protein